VTAPEFGDKWPFVLGEVELACARGAAFVIAQGRTYALSFNDREKLIDGKPVSLDLQGLQTEKARFFETSGMKRLTEMGYELCKQN
jgi:hypothetical protein